MNVYRGVEDATFRWDFYRYPTVLLLDVLSTWTFLLVLLLVQ